MELGSSLELLEFDLEGIDPTKGLTPDLIAELDKMDAEEIEEMILDLEDLEDWEAAALKVLKEYQTR